MTTRENESYQRDQQHGYLKSILFGGIRRHVVYVIQQNREKPKD